LYILLFTKFCTIPLLPYFFFLRRCGPTRVMAFSSLRFQDYAHWTHHCR
jgi:hypothetical protein